MLFINTITDKINLEKSVKAYVQMHSVPIKNYYVDFDYFGSFRFLKRLFNNKILLHTGLPSSLVAF